MAGNNTVNINLSVQDQSGSVKARTNDTKQLNKELEKAERLAGKTFAAKSGERAAGGITGLAMTEGQYTQARGAAGVTGASARDFAAQAQGLGGLVRLYATWAANVYAVGAAFTALRQAAGVENMIAGMNQLGVASGTALGSMSKDLVRITGNAISMQEAISATVKATSSGISGSQLQQLGLVATKASRALGVDMNDALNRLTRGITKLEPELLDELGIFTKVGTATEQYAKSVGKSAASLTDFERRQAFANAVLKEGLDKFGEIEVAANPYDKLAASLTDLSQKALGIINTVLGPLINLLSSSPTALTGAMAALALMIVKQALPAIGQYKQALTDAADESARRWQARANEVRAIEKDNYQYLLNLTEAEAEKRVAAIEKAEKRIQKIRKDTAFKTSPMADKAQEIISRPDWRSVTEEDRKYLRDLAKIERTAGNEQLAKAYEKADVALRQWIKSEREHYEALKQVEAQAHKNMDTFSRFSQQGITRDKAEAERQKAARLAAVSQAVQDVPTRGVRDAWNTLNMGLAQENLSALNKAYGKIAGGAAIATTATVNFISAISGIVGWVGAAIGVFSMLYGWVSKNGEATKELDAAVESASETYKTASQSIEKFNNTLSLQGIEAVSNALAGLADTTTSVIDKLNKFNLATRGIDSAWEGIKSVFGMSEQDKASKAISQNIMGMLEGIRDPAVRAEFESAIKSTLDIATIDFAELDDAIENIDPKTLKALEPVLNKLSISSRATSASITAIRDSFKEVETAYNALGAALKTTDPISNFADAVAKQAVTLQQAFKDSGVAAATFQAILADNSKLAAFPPQMQADILARSKDFEALTSSIKKSETELKSLEAGIVEATGIKDEASQRKLFEQLNKDLNLRFENLDLWKQLKQKFKLNLDVQEANTKLKNLAGDLGQAAAKQMEYAFKIASAKAGSAGAQANIEQQKTVLSYLNKSVGTIEIASKLEQRSIDIRIKEIQAIYELTQQMKIAVVEAKLLEAKRARDAAEPSDRKFFEENITKLEQERKLYTDKNISVRDIRVDSEGNVISGKYAGVSAQAVKAQYDTQRGYSDQLTTLLGQKQNIAIKAQMDKYIQQLDDAAAGAKAELEEKERAKKEFVESSKYLALTYAEQAAYQDKWFEETKPLREKVFLAETGKQVEVAKFISTRFAGTDVGAEAARQLQGIGPDGKPTGAPGLLESLQLKREEFAGKETGEQRARKRADAEKLLSLELDRQGRAQDVLAEKTQLTHQAALDYTNSTKEQLLQQIENSGLVSESQAEQLKALDLLAIAQERSLAIDNEKAQSARKVLDAELKLKAVRDGNLTLSADEIQSYKDLISSEKELTDQRIQNINRVYDARERLREQQLDENTRLGAYAEAFKNAFSAMEDAVVEFAKTGELSFESMINSFLEDLLRFELRRMQATLFEGVGGAQGLANSLMQAFGGPSGGVSVPAVSGGDFTAAMQSAVESGWVYPSAKGSYYDGSVAKFAKGGTFTNSVINSPTLFKFAKGTGLMGEAGPEAIMPLKRDANGNLGVRSTPSESKVEVVVNNYSGEPAQAIETRDSRGNRKVEIVVGELTAAEMARSGSASQQSVSSTFGLRPTLIRR